MSQTLVNNMIDRVLFVMEKYCDADPKRGPTASECQLVGVVESTGLVGETKRFYYENLCQRVGKEAMAKLLVEDCQVFQPNLVIYSTLGGLLGFNLNPPNWALQEVRRMGITLLTWIWDTTGIEGEIKWRWIPYSDYICIADSVVTMERFEGDPRVIQAYCPVDSRVFYNKNLDRNINVSFVGGMDPARWPQRAQQINFLRMNGIDIVAVGGQRDNRLSWSEYASFFQKSKISLNWSKNPRVNTCQLKGRVFETMACGAMLLEDNGEQTTRLFEPDKDFVIFNDSEDMLKKIRYYLEHENERQAIARSGWEKVTSIYNAKNMWGYIFEQIGFGEMPNRDNNSLLHNRKVESLCLRSQLPTINMVTVHCHSCNKEIQVPTNPSGWWTLCEDCRYKAVKELDRRGVK